MQRIYQESDSHSKTIYVRYESKQGETANAPIYMPLTATVLKPVGAVKTKIAEYWYENGTTTRLNVAYPKDGGNTLTYVVELDQVWEVVDDVNKPQFSPTTGFASYTDAIFAKQAANSADGGYKYFFAAETMDMSCRLQTNCRNRVTSCLWTIRRQQTSLLNNMMQLTTIHCNML